MECFSQGTPEYRLLVVDDHRLVREGLVALFRAAGMVEVVGVGSRNAVDTARLLDGEVVLIGIDRPHGPALQAGRQMLARSSRPRLLFLDEEIRGFNLRAVLSAGAPGYWTKHASFDQLARAVRRVAAGETSFCPQAQRYLVSNSGRLQYRPPPDAEPLATLTNREIDVLVMLAEGLNNNQCAERLQLAPNTVGNHRSRLMSKLGVHKVADLVRLAMRNGLVSE